MNSGSKQFAANDHFKRGLTLFNSGYFFECHEEWEEVWKRSVGEEKNFHQGLIQAAVALLHVQRGNLSGAASIYAKARVRLEAFPRDHGGIALGKLREDLRAFITAAIIGEPLPEAPKILTLQCRR